MIFISFHPRGQSLFIYLKKLKNDGKFERLPFFPLMAFILTLFILFIHQGFQLIDNCCGKVKPRQDMMDSD